MNLLLLKILKSSFCIGLLLFSSWALSKERFIDGVNVVVDAGTPFKIGQRWSNEARTELIGGKITFKSAARGVILDSPIAKWLYLPINYEGRFRKMGKIIASTCKKKHPDDVISAISCAATSVNKTLKQTGWPDTFTFCRSHTAAFRAAFDALEIPRSHIFDVEASTSTSDHVVTRFNLTTKTGMTHSYVIDTGNSPNKVFPNTRITENWHKKNKVGFPDFSYDEPRYQFRPAKPAKSAK